MRAHQPGVQRFWLLPHLKALTLRLTMIRFPRYFHVFLSDTEGQNKSVGYNICNCRVCMRTRVSGTTMYVHTILGSIPDSDMQVHDL